jgi:NAD(P)-dependent dehydrogenase (short-subunit alcohol dehydrogenase family)
MTANSGIPPAALVTGAGKRIGRSIALELARAGFAIAVHYRNSKTEAEAVAAEIAAGGGKAVALCADLAIESETANLLPRAAAALGPIGCIVNNASLFERDDALTATRASWGSHLQVNLRAPFVLTQEFARALPGGAKGVVINILDQRVWNLTPHFLSYTLSRASLWALTQTLALALAPAIRVNAVGPGPVLASARQDPAQFAEQARATPLGRVTRPEEVAMTVRFLIEQPSITGQMIATDGGQHMSWAPALNRPLPEE